MGKYTTGDRFIIEIDAWDEETEGSYRIKDTSFRVNENILDNWERYTDRLDDSWMFHEGVDFAQSVYKKLHSLPGFQIKEIFNVGGGTAWAVIQKYSVEEIDTMISEYDPKIEMGDKFCITDNIGNFEQIIITNIDSDEDIYFYMQRDGKTGSIKGKENLVKKIHRRIGRPSVSKAYKSAIDFIFSVGEGVE